MDRHYAIFNNYDLRRPIGHIVIQTEEYGIEEALNECAIVPLVTVKDGVSTTTSFGLVPRVNVDVRPRPR